MKIKNEMIHEELRSHLPVLRSVPVLVSRKTTKNMVDRLIRRAYKGKELQGIKSEELYIDSSDSKHKIRVKIYKPENHKGKLPIMLYVHGGGYIIGNPEQFETMIERFINTRPCIIVSPDYRLAPEHPYPAGFNDCYDTLLWAKDHAEEMNGSAKSFMIGGHSAGGGMTAALTLKVRDTKAVNLAFQMPIYPMIDDTQPYDPDRHMHSPAWDSRSNKFGWESYLKELKDKGEEIPPYAAPSRNKDYNNLPPTISFVGNVEPFYQETVDYVENLRIAGTDVKFKVYEKCYHGFDLISKNSISKDALDFTFDNYAEFYDKYIEV